MGLSKIHFKKYDDDDYPDIDNELDDDNTIEIFVNMPGNIDTVSDNSESEYSSENPSEFPSDDDYVPNSISDDDDDISDENSDDNDIESNVSSISSITNENTEKDDWFN